MIVFALTVVTPLGASVYAYFKIYRHLKPLGNSRVDGHTATSTEAAIAMKMLVVMALFMACWTPAVVMATPFHTISHHFYTVSYHFTPGPGLPAARRRFVLRDVDRGRDVLSGHWTRTRPGQVTRPVGQGPGTPRLSILRLKSAVRRG